MSYSRFFLFVLVALLSSCAASSNKDSIAQLKDMKIELSDSKIEGGFEKAMQSYQKFLEQTPESSMTPEALRRLADLKIQKEYGTFEGATANEKKASPENAKKIARPATFDTPAKIASVPEADIATAPQLPLAVKAGKNKNGKESVKESGQDFETRATKTVPIKSASADEIVATPDGSGADLQSAGALEAIVLYKKLLSKYPNYERNDQVLYQLSRAYEEMGQVEEAMKIMNKIVKDYPKSRYIDEVQFRRGEYYFTRKKFMDAEDAYKSIVDMGAASFYYELALYKLGWSFYKQELYEDALHRFVALLDYKISTGYDFEHPKDTIDEKRIEDTYSVVSLAFSNLGGADAVMEYFNKFGKRKYEVNVYSNLGDYYLDKRRYSDAATTYKAFVKSNPYHKVAPHFDTRVIDIYKKGGFPKLVIESNKEFVVNYGLKSDYWKHFDIKAFPEVLGYVKTSLKELANHYHALYQEKKFEKDKSENFQEAMKWYREFLNSFPKEFESPAINYQLAALLLENKSFGQAALEYEHTAYDYPFHEKSSDAGYAAVYAYRENLAIVAPDERERVKRDVVRSSLKFAESFPQHQKAALVMEAAVDDIYAMKDYAFAVTTGRKLLNNFPLAEQNIRRSTWLIVAHASFDMANFKDAEEGYLSVLQLTDESDKSRADVIENLAASIYKQGEQASKLSDYKSAAEHFLRVAQAAPASKICPAADFDGATALMQLKDWDRAASVLNSFRSHYVGHKLQPEVTKKIAYVYKESGKLSLAAAEYERIETESQDVAVRREALQLAADLYVEAKETDKAMQVYRRYVSYFPKPLELALETRNKIAGVLKARNDTSAYLEELKQIVAADAGAGAERTDRTRYLGATSSLVLTEPLFGQFVEIKLVKPFDKNLIKKKNAMKSAKDGFEKLLSYEVGDVTAAATYYLAEIYYNFNRSLVESERPEDLNALEKEQYELAIDEQASPFEEKAIQIHEKNLELLSLGIFNSWIESSFDKLAKLLPARYAKFEESSGYIGAIDTVSYAALTDPLPVLAKQILVPAPVQPAPEPDPAPVQEPVPVQAEAPVQLEIPQQVAVKKPVTSKKTIKSKKRKPPVQEN
jgi:tetratricopeptide (TPR) repeat protein